MTATLDQVDLFPAEQEQPSLLMIDPEHVAEHELIGPEPSQALVSSIKRYGFWGWSPVLVKLLPDGTFHLVDGIRRVKAAKRLGLREVPAWAATFQGWSDTRIISLATQVLATKNMASRLHSVEALRDKGLSDSQIAEYTGISLRDLRNQIVPLLGLPAELREALDNGRMRQGTALAAAKLGVEGQQYLVSLLHEEERIVGRHVQAARAHERGEQSEKQPALFQPAVQQEVVEELNSKQLLQLALERLPSATLSVGYSQARSAIEFALDGIGQAEAEAPVVDRVASSPEEATALAILGDIKRREAIVASELPPLPAEETPLAPQASSVPEDERCDFCEGLGQVSMVEEDTKVARMISCIACNGTGVAF